MTKKTYSHTYVNFYVALTATSALFAGILVPHVAVYLAIFMCLSATWCGVSLLVERHKRTH